MPLHRHHAPFSFFFTDTATTDIYPLSLHDALPISSERAPALRAEAMPARSGGTAFMTIVMLGEEKNAKPRPCTARTRDRKSTRLNSSHTVISYAVFCLKKKKKNKQTTTK